MAEPASKKNILSQALNALTDKDEKAALAAMQLQLTAAQEAAKKAAQELATLKMSGGFASAQVTAANKRAADAEAQVKKLQEQVEAILHQKQLDEAKARIDAAMKTQLEAAKPKFVAEHTLKSDETLSHLSLKYYGSATKPYWMLIYEANKATIGDNPNKVRPGTVLNIPALPEEMKKKK